MARIVRHEANGPMKIEPAQFPRDEQGNLKPIFICACGISNKLPFCDGTHKTCKTEEAGHIYEYDPVTKAVTSKKAE
jgi:CDGSH-type Zn-finger protein